MSDNPFEPPRDASQAVGVLSGRREDLRTIARFQKGILVCILIYLIAVIGQFALPPELRIFMAIGVMIVALTGAVFVFLLAIKVYGVGLLSSRGSATETRGEFRYVICRTSPRRRGCGGSDTW